MYCEKIKLMKTTQENDIISNNNYNYGVFDYIKEGAGR